MRALLSNCRELQREWLKMRFMHGRRKSRMSRHLNARELRHEPRQDLSALTWSAAPSKHSLLPVPSPGGILVA